MKQLEEELKDEKQTHQSVVEGLRSQLNVAVNEATHWEQQAEKYELQVCGPGSDVRVKGTVSVGVRVRVGSRGY